MSQVPQTAGGPSPWSEGPVEPVPRRGVGKPIAIALLVIVMGMLVVFITMGGLAYYFVRQAVQPTHQVALPERTGRGESDSAALADALQRPGQAVHPEEAEIRQWFSSQMDRASRGQPVVPRSELFYAAVISGPDGAAMNFLQRIKLRASLSAGVPEPTAYGSYTVMDVAPDTAPDTARAAVVFYDSDSLATLHTWFLVKTDQRWELYDWFDADVGRRMSDEYGNYCRELSDDHADGYDRVEQLVSDASVATSKGDTTRARALLEQAETIRTLPYDRDRALLSIGRGYQHLDDDSRAVQVFQRAEHPEAVPGIWASLGVSQSGSETPEAALESAKRLRTVYPTHPAADFISAYAYEQLGREPEAAEHYLRCLSLCPDDATCYAYLLDVAQPEHAGAVVHAVQASENSEQYLLELFDRFEDHPEMLAAVDAALAESEGAPAAWKGMSEASMQRARGDVGGALRRLKELLARSGVTDGLRSQQERWLVQWSTE